MKKKIFENHHLAAVQSDLLYCRFPIIYIVVTSVAAFMFSDSCFHSLINSLSKSKLLYNCFSNMIYTNEHYIRLKHVQLYERIYQIFLDHPLNDSNSSLKSTCCCVFTTSNKPTTVFWLLLGGNLQEKQDIKP